MISKGDVLAAIDVLVQLTEESDQLEADEAIVMMELLADLKSKAAIAYGSVQTAVVNKLESGSREIEGRLYYRKAAGVYRTYHADVHAAVVGQSVVDRDGVIRDAKEAAQRAVHLMEMLYVSASTNPKIAGLDALGLSKKKVMRWEKTGTTVNVVDMQDPE